MIAKARAKAPNSQRASRGIQAQVEQVGVGKGGDAVLTRLENGYANDRRQHQRGPKGGVEEKLDRGVNPALSAPDADDEVHRNQDRFEEHEEEE